MDKKKLQEAFADIHAPEALVGKVLKREKTKHNYRSMLVAASLAVVCLISGFLMGAGLSHRRENAPESVMTAHVDWDLHGFWVNADGEVLEEVDFSYEARIYANGDYERMPRLDEYYSMPDTFPYVLEGRREGMVPVYGTQLHGQPYYFWGTFTYDKVAEDLEMGYFALSVEKEWMLMFWKAGEEDRILVASRDPEADPKEILSYFEAMLRWCRQGGAYDLTPETRDTIRKPEEE